jgi:hypothetical protein
MSWVDCIAYFFIETDDAIAATVKGATSSNRPTEVVFVETYDPEEAVTEWEALLASLDPSDLVQAGEPRHVAQITNDGCYVFVLSERLQHLLAGANSDERGRVAHLWSRARKAASEDIEEVEAARHLAALAALARAATSKNNRLYCSGW